MTEQWRSTYHPNYEVSDLGRVRSWVQQGRWGLRLSVPRILRVGIPSNGYPLVQLGKNNPRAVHQLVAIAFLGPCPSGQEVRHRDGDKLNMRSSNLSYGTHGENMRDEVQTGRWFALKTTLAQRVVIRDRYKAGATQARLAVQFGISQPQVSVIVRRAVNQ